MGTRPFKMLEETCKLLPVTSNEIVVEIGSDRGEGSTAFFRDWAKQKGLEFHTVDVLDDAKRYFETNLESGGADGINFHVVSTGHAWCRDELPSMNKKIKVLYLDNFDWIDPVNLQYQWLHDQISDYASRGVVMNNENSQEEHRLQALYCLPHLADACAVLIDDSWMDVGGPTGWGGKCGTAIPLLLANGFRVEQNSYGIVCYRGFELTN